MSKSKKFFCVIFAFISALVSFCTVGFAAVSVKLGDADCSGTINVADARIILRCAVKLETVTADMIKVCDVDSDGGVDVEDARLVLRHAVVLEKLPDKTVQISAKITYSDTEKQNTEEDKEEDKNDEKEEEQKSEADLLGDLSSYPLPTIPSYTKKSGYFTFIVYGDGHGIGFSQYGGVYMAQKGCSYQYILNYYFPNTSIRQDENIPLKTTYVGQQYDTMELLCRMVAQEIGGIQPPVEALKAQTVCIYTRLKDANFNIKGKWDVATICDTSSWIWTNSWTQNTLIPVVSTTMGQYLADSNGKPVLTVYSRMAAGATVNCSDEWYASYPVSVKSPFEMTNSDFVKIYQFSKDEIKKKILAAYPNAKLGSDPSTWIQIVKHTASIDKNRGYVTEVKVGDQTLKKVGTLSSKLGLGLRSGCFTVEYTK
jgi:hypothetical protein